MTSELALGYKYLKVSHVAGRIWEAGATSLRLTPAPSRAILGANYTSLGDQKMADDRSLEFNPVSRITVGTVGRPGQRMFFLQVAKGVRLLTVKLEKEQVAALAQGIEAVLEELEQREIRPVSREDEPPGEDLSLESPIEVAFVVEQIALAFDQETAMMVLIVQGLVEDEDEDEDIAPVSAQIWASAGQMRALSRHAREVVSHGRAICPLCGEPIDPDGHFCPRGNGHSKRVPAS